MTNSKPQIIILIVSLLALLLVGVTLYLLSVRTESLKLSHIQDTEQTHYNYKKLEFCHNNTIVRCNDDQVILWNKAHPDNTFELKSFKQIMEDAEVTNKNAFWQY